jgi:hypothetical protein
MIDYGYGRESWGYIVMRDGLTIGFYEARRREWGSRYV